MSLGRTVKLNTGAVLPQIGFGTWQSKPGEVERAVSEAIKVGYRHIDCALVYQNQNEVADGIADSGIDRSELFVVSKLWNNSHRPSDVEKDLDLTLSQLRMPYLDCWLIHWPVAFAPGDDLFPKEADGKTCVIDPQWSGIVATWEAVVKVSKETGKARAVGVSNFTVEQIEALIKGTGVVPAMNQIECHPSLIQPELFEYCKEKGIQITAYSPLGNNITGKARVVDAPQVQAIAKRLNKEPAQVLIAWGAHQGFCVIPKSVTPSRIASNFQDFELSDADFEAINEFGRAHQVRSNIPAVYTPIWPINLFDEPEETKYPGVKY